MDQQLNPLAHLLLGQNIDYTTTAVLVVGPGRQARTITIPEYLFDFTFGSYPAKKGKSIVLTFGGVIYSPDTILLIMAGLDVLDPGRHMDFHCDGAYCSSAGGVCVCTKSKIGLVLATYICLHKYSGNTSNLSAVRFVDFVESVYFAKLVEIKSALLLGYEDQGRHDALMAAFSSLAPKITHPARLYGAQFYAWPEMVKIHLMTQMLFWLRQVYPDIMELGALDEEKEYLPPQLLGVNPAGAFEYLLLKFNSLVEAPPVILPSALPSALPSSQPPNSATDLVIKVTYKGKEPIGREVGQKK